MSRDMVCDNCQKEVSNLHYEGSGWYCRPCHVSDSSFETAYIKAAGWNPIAPKATKAHVEDVKDRRWHPQEKRMFYYSKEKPKTYFFPKG